jgi:hypothetical protein
VNLRPRNRVKFDDRGIEIRSTGLDSTYQTSGYRGISTGVFLPAAEYCQDRSGGRRCLKINLDSSSLHVRKCSPSPSGRTLWPSMGHRLTTC